MIEDKPEPANYSDELKRKMIKSHVLLASDSAGASHAPAYNWWPIVALAGLLIVIAVVVVVSGN